MFGPGLGWTALAVALTYAAGFRLLIAADMVKVPAWAGMPWRGVRAGWAWVRVVYRRRSGGYRGRHHVRRFEGSYSAATKRGRSIPKRRQTGV